MGFLNQIINASYQLVSQNILSSILITSICILISIAVYNSKNKHQYWAKKNVAGPKPLPIVGNFLSLFSKNRLQLELEWVKKYGKVYGVYFGNSPRLLVADPEVIQQICIKDFEAFPNHDKAEFSHKYDEFFLIRMQNEQWKRTRALMSPTFTSGKIKRMFRFLDGCADDLVQSFQDQLKQQQQAKVNVKDLYSLFTMDAIATCCYGLKLERASGATSLKAAASRDDFVAQAMKLFEFSIPRMTIRFTFPTPLLRLFNFKVKLDSSLEPLAKRVDHLIKQRRGSQKKFDDYLQLLIDAKLDDKMELNAMDTEENHHAALTHESLLEDQKQLISDSGTDSKVTLNDFEILSSAMFLMAVGLETTGTLLSHCTYALAFHPEIQERLHEELMKVAEFDEKDKKRYQFNYDLLTSCKFLDSVLSETLRLLSPVLQIDRVSNREYHIKKYNITLPKDSNIMLGLYAILNDKDYWDHPERFDPDRFMPANRDKIVPGSYCPFGLGPRHCLGMRFSLTEAKLALAKMIMNYQFEPSPGTQFPPEATRILGLHNIKNPYVIVKPRT